MELASTEQSKILGTNDAFQPVTFLKTFHFDDFFCETVLGTLNEKFVKLLQSKSGDNFEPSGMKNHMQRPVGSGDQTTEPQSKGLPVVVVRSPIIGQS